MMLLLAAVLALNADANAATPTTNKMVPAANRKPKKRSKSFMI